MLIMSNIAQNFVNVPLVCFCNLEQFLEIICLETLKCFVTPFLFSNESQGEVLYLVFYPRTRPRIKNKIQNPSFRLKIFLSIQMDLAFEDDFLVWFNCVWPLGNFVSKLGNCKVV